MTRLKDLPHVHCWLATPLPTDVADSLTRLALAPDVVRMAVMPDVHLSSEVCVGVCLATRTVIYPAAVGGDIGCGMLAVRFHAEAAALQSEAAAARLLAGLYRRVPSLKHRTSSAPSTLPQGLVDLPLSHPSLEKLKSRDARLQLGTLGRGNHFVEFQSDDEGALWLMLHSGSRGMGQSITAHHYRVAGTAARESRLNGIDSQSSAGRAYLNDHDWARAYAAANRLSMLDAIATLLLDEFKIDLDRETSIHTDHNHGRQEVHDGQAVWVHRKGSQSANENELGIIPGSMGTSSHHVIGRGHVNALRSSSHGAGRLLSRTEASRRISVAQLRRELQHVRVDGGRLSELRDEAPSAYRDIRQVMSAQRDLCRIVRTLKPVVNYKR